MSGLEIIAAAGLATSLYGQISGASAKADADRKNAQIKNMEADELLSRQTINEGIMRDQAELQGLGYQSSFASTGREGAGLGGLLTIKKNLDQNLILSRRDAEFKAKMLRMGADIDLNLASDEQTAGYISGAGTLLTGAAKIYDLSRGPSNTTQSLPKVGG